MLRYLPLFWKNITFQHTHVHENKNIILKIHNTTSSFPRYIKKIIIMISNENLWTSLLLPGFPATSF